MVYRLWFEMYCIRINADVLYEISGPKAAKLPADHLVSGAICSCQDWLGQLPGTCLAAIASVRTMSLHQFEICVEEVSICLRSLYFLGLCF